MISVDAFDTIRTPIAMHDAISNVSMVFSFNLSLVDKLNTKLVPQYPVF